MLKAEARDMIQAVARRACFTAGIDFDELEPGATPLFQIITAHPLRVAELPETNLRLRFSTATDFISRELGQAVNVPTGDDCPLSGFLYAHEFGGDFYGVVLTEKGDPTARRRYSAAHELGHYLLHFLPLLKVRSVTDEPDALIWTEGLSFNEGNEADAATIVAKPSPALKTEAEIEHEANLFAAELLMPEHACQAFANNYQAQFRLNKTAMTRRMAGEFFVSFEAMRWRLVDLDL